MNLSDILHDIPLAQPSRASARRALSEPFRLRGRIERKPLAVCRFERAQSLIRFCGFTAAAARRDAAETFPA